MRVTPINMAEAIFEPFWDPQRSGLSQWTIEPGEAHGLRVSQNWCWATFEWARKPAQGPALKMSRAFDVPCADYDDLLVSVMAPPAAVVTIRALTDRGEREFRAPPAPLAKKEHAVELGGASRILRVTLEVEAAGDGVATGWLNWIGLRNRDQLDRYLKSWRRFDETWEGYLHPESTPLSFAPHHGLFVNERELGLLRDRHEAMVRETGTSPFLEAAKAARARVPEEMVGEYVNFWGDTRYNRERDHDRPLLVQGPNAVLAGLVLRDASLVRLGARYALSIAQCANWDDGMICRFPDGNFDHRCFVQSLCAFETALVLDLAGDCFTPVGRDLVLRRLATEALGVINFNTWRYEYIFHCNQLAWFTPGRMLAYLLLERYWKHVAPYTEIAFRDLSESLEGVILPDGGYVEGPTYFTCVGRSGGLPLYLYSRARGLAFEKVLPASMRRCGAFGEVIASTDAGQDVVPFCDAGARLDPATEAVMAAALPGTAWSRMLAKTMARASGGSGAPIPGNLVDLSLAWVLSDRQDAPDPAPFVFLPEMGVLSSTRRWKGEWVKLFIMGNQAGAGHTHEDKGSFVLEYAGETLAMDSGTCDYSSPFAGLAHNCERHNMLVPYGLPDRPRPRCPLPADVKPKGAGDAVSLRATLDATPGWEGLYRRWVRTWDSPAPDRLVVHDEYELERGEGVEFYWMTAQPVRVEGSRACVLGRRSQATIEAPAGCEVRVDDVPFFNGVVHHRIAIRKSGKAGVLDVGVILSQKEGSA